MKRKTMTTVLFLLMLALVLAGCGKTEFGVIENTGKRMVITAQKADEGSFLTTGSLEVAEGEQITLSADLKKGTVRVEILPVEEEQSIDQLPELDGEPVLKADLHLTDAASAEMLPGNYLLRATCLETATGTVTVEVTPVQ